MYILDIKFLGALMNDYFFRRNYKITNELKKNIMVKRLTMLEETYLRKTFNSSSLNLNLEITEDKYQAQKNNKKSSCFYVRPKLFNIRNECVKDGDLTSKTTKSSCVNKRKRKDLDRIE